MCFIRRRGQELENIKVPEVIVSQELTLENTIQRYGNTTKVFDKAKEIKIPEPIRQYFFVISAKTGLLFFVYLLKAKPLSTFSNQVDTVMDYRLDFKVYETHNGYRKTCSILFSGH